jgi:hypothetical protein
MPAEYIGREQFFGDTFLTSVANLAIGRGCLDLLQVTSFNRVTKNDTHG